RQFADFIEEQRTAIGQFKTARLVLERACKRPFYVPKELALEKTFRHRAAIQFDQRAFASRALLVDGPRDELLSRAAFPGDQDGSIGRRNELNLLHHLSQAGTSPDDVAEILFGADFIEQISVLSLEPRLFLLHQHPVGDIKKHHARVPAARLPLRPPVNPYRTAVSFSTQLETCPARVSPA